ncbi:lipase maturation factor family protein [Curtobacterium sp. MCJR17_043]|uniref:lipase maturation factor family protein n=1 Tax=Curtobacterium sp. MCJR17_043 TaxID=2175660 RepID=UPI0032E92541
MAPRQRLRCLRQRDAGAGRGHRRGGPWRRTRTRTTGPPYEFKGKPGDPRRRPAQFAPYHLRLDWLMWFLALGADDGWFRVFVLRLLEADRPTLRLLRHDPFDGQRPRWVRARVFRYRFATRAERRATGLHWIRQERGLLLPPSGLRR